MIDPLPKNVGLKPRGAPGVPPASLVVCGEDAGAPRLRKFRTGLEFIQPFQDASSTPAGIGAWEIFLVEREV